tara:strand:+ start:3210 stop:3881 length:672 start_codon:yes stop_codon:yes gene_type:complete
MPLQINRKIIVYLFIFFILGTYTNKKFSSLNFPEINSYNIIGLSNIKNDQIHQDLSILQNKNLFFLEKKKISKIINSYPVIERFSVFKHYPSSLNIVIERTSFLALTKKNGHDFYIGSNGNLILTDNKRTDLPFVFGNIKISDFLRLKKIIDNSNFNYDNIKNLYYFKSRRWDIETKDDLIIKLPFKRLDVSFDILSKIYDNQKFKDIEVIDLRQENLVILDG